MSIQILCPFFKLVYLLVCFRFGIIWVLHIFRVFTLIVLVTQSCLSLCDPVECSPPGSSVHGILQARILEWGAMSSSRGSSWPGDQIWVSCIAGRFFTIWVTSFLSFSSCLIVLLMVSFLVWKLFALVSLTCGDRSEKKIATTNVNVFFLEFCVSRSYS